MAYSAEIAVKVNGLNSVKTLETSLNKISGKINAINKISVGSTKASRVEKEIAKSKEAQRVSMIQTRRVGDAVQRQTDKGLSTEKAKAAIKKAAKADAQGQLKVSDAQRKIALEELKINQNLTKEKIKQVNLQRQMASPIGGTRTMMGSPTQLGFAGSGMGRSPIGGTKFQFGSPSFFEAGAKAGGARSPVSGTRFDFGSPAQLAFSGGPSSRVGGSRFEFGSPAQQAFSGGPSSSIRGSKTTFGSPAFFDAAAKAGGPSIPIKGSKDIFGSPAYYDAANKEALRVAKANAMPIKGFKSLPGSPAFHEDQAKKLKKLRGAPTGFSAAEFGPQQPMQGPAMGPTSMGLNFDKRTGKLLRGPAGSNKNTLTNLGRRFDTQSALISGAFPLLFGQGPVGALAGGLGGGIGGMFGTMGGFAGGIAATAIVQQIQSAISAIGELGRALGPFARDTKAVTSALGLQGSAQEAQLQLIEQTQGKTAAFNAAMNFMAAQIGQKGVNSLKRFGENSRLITASLTLATTKLQAFGASILNFILRISGAEKQLRKAEQERTISFAASRGDETAKSIQAEQKRIDNIPLQFGAMGSTFKSKEAEDAQEALDKRKALFTVREKERINLAKINSEQGAHVQTLEEEFALVNKVNELVKSGVEKGLAEKLAKNEQINKKAIENIKIRQDEVKRELEGLDKIKNKSDEQKLAVDDLKEKQKFLTEELEKQPGILDDMNEKTKSLHSEVDKVTEAFKELSVTIGEDIKEGIKGLIKGTSTLSDLLNNVADKFLDIALNQALFGDILGSKGDKGGGILGFLTGGKLAEGGRAAGGKSFLVGEKGPELFVPRSTGTVIPNNKLGGGNTNNVVVNVDASGSDVQGDEAAAKEIGTLISVAVQGELLKQQRPGGLLSR